MATVTGMTAAAMQAIRDETVVNAAFDSANHLILTKYDGTQIDAGIVASATTTASGLVELATSAETQTGTDAVRAVTPQGLASIPGNKVQILADNALTESAAYSSYPVGISQMELTDSSGWSLASGYGAVVTYYIDLDRVEQTFYCRAGGALGTPRAWVRYSHSTDNGGGWTAWHQIMIMVNLDPASFNESTVRSSYPAGTSRLYYTVANGTGWSFSGTAGDVVTYSEDTNLFSRQVFTSHVGGSSKPFQWFRTANAASGWTSWQPVFTDQGAWSTYTPTWTGATTNPSLGNGTIVGRYVKLGHSVTVVVTLTPGSTTTFGSGNYAFSLPFTSANQGATYVGNAHLIGTDRWLGQVIISPNVATMSPFFVTSSTDNRSNFQTSVRPETFASGANLRMSVKYETAT